MAGARLGDQHARAAGGLDLLLGERREELGLDDKRRLGQAALAEHLEDALAHAVDHRRFRRGRSLARLRAHKRPQLLDVDGRAVELVHRLVEVPHTNLTEVTRVVFVHHDAVVVLATGVTATARVLPVLADTALAVRHVTAQLARSLALNLYFGCVHG